MAVGSLELGQSGLDDGARPEPNLRVVDGLAPEFLAAPPPIIDHQPDSEASVLDGLASKLAALRTALRQLPLRRRGLTNRLQDGGGGGNERSIQSCVSS